MKDYKELIERLRRKANLTEHVHVAREFRAAADAIEELLNENRWTPVSEGLPKEDKPVIASTLYGVFPEARYTKEYGWEWAYEAGADYWEGIKGVIAWMPLPEPYKGEKE